MEAAYHAAACLLGLQAWEELEVVVCRWVAARRGEEAKEAWAVVEAGQPVVDLLPVELGRASREHVLEAAHACLVAACKVGWACWEAVLVAFEACVVEGDLQAF
jgi:hypothetical protein